MQRKRTVWVGLSIVLGLVAVGGLLGLFGRPVHADSLTLSVTDVADASSLMAEVVDSGHGAAPGPAAIPLFSPGNCTVTSTLDTGPGSLRACMVQLGAGDVITFDTTIFLPGNPQTIALNSPLPTLVTDNVTIDGSNAGVILDGSGTPGGTSGLVIDGASNVVIKGLQILNFPYQGIELINGASNNTIGGTNGSPGGSCSGDCNLISGNGTTYRYDHGVFIADSGTTNNTVSGNYIGTDINGTAAISNTGSGVFITSDTQYNLIGGTTDGERNLISGNGTNGVSIRGGAMSNTVIGNYIGTDASGTAALGNGSVGVWIGSGAQHNIIGGDMAAKRNIISGNHGLGVLISESGTMSNTVSGNYIGTDASGTAATSNTGGGVSISNGAQYNVIGGDTPGERNLISGNGGLGAHDYGVKISGDGTTHNTVSGNYIGTSVSGTAAIGNDWGGVGIFNGAKYNVIGGDTAGERNLISGNGHHGVSIYFSGTDHNRVSGNYIGTNASGTSALGNGTIGVTFGASVQHNVIGGENDSPGGPCTGECNLISGNSAHGVLIENSTTTMNNIVSGNYIGTDVNGTAAIPNNTHGVEIRGSVQYNVIGGDTAGKRNLISGNDGHGVYIHDSGTIRNTITQNSIYGNTGKGIELSDGGNLELFPPILNHVGTNTVEGQAPPGSTVEIFSDADDEGRYFHGFTAADASGNFTFTQASAFTGTNVTATATDGDGNTSEFSAAYEPLVDVQVVAILQPKSSGKRDQMVTPTIKVGNAGTTAETGINVAVQATGSALSSDYGPHNKTADLPPLGYATLTFPPLTPDTVGTYSFIATVTLAGDQNPGNDVKTQTVAVASDVIDLWTRDNESDVGDVPAYPFWQSPDVWVRNADDGGAGHQDPIAGQTNYVYMIVRNRGSAASDGADTAKVYWHEPSLGIKCGDWAPIGTATIASVPANTGTQLLKFNWTPTRTGHTCLHGEIISDDDPVMNPCDIPWDNNLSQRNVDIIPGGEGISGQDIGAQVVGSMVFEVTNIKDAPKPVAIIVDVSNVPDANAVRLDLGSDLSARWASVNGMAKSSGVAWSGGSLITVTNPSSGTVAGIPMDAGETQTVTLLVNAPSVEMAPVTVYEAIDAGPGIPLIDAIVGGNTYIFTEAGDIYLPLILKND